MLDVVPARTGVTTTNTSHYLESPNTAPLGAPDSYIVGYLPFYIVYPSNLLFNVGA